MKMAHSSLIKPVVLLFALNCMVSCVDSLNGRRRRETAAVQPHFYDDDTPCPQTAWKEILEWGIKENDPSASIDAIQLDLHSRYTGHKFLVTCAVATDSGTVTNRVHFSASGEAYCNAVKDRVWCQAIELMS